MTDLAKVGWTFGRSISRIAQHGFSGGRGDSSRDKLTILIENYLPTRSEKKNEPVAITGIMANGRNVTLSESFKTSDPEWLKGLTLTFQKTSDRTIKSVSFYLIIREGHPVHPPSAEPVLYGTSMQSKKAETLIVVPIAPGQTGGG